MESESKHYGNALERLGRQTLVQLSGLPEMALHWPLPLPDGDSLFARAGRLVEESAFWVLEVIGGSISCIKKRGRKNGSKVRRPSGGAHAAIPGLES